MLLSAEDAPDAPAAAPLPKPVPRTLVRTDVSSPICAAVRPTHSRSNRPRIICGYTAFRYIKIFMPRRRKGSGSLFVKDER